MSTLFMDGFSHYQTSDILRKWTAKSDTGVTWEIAAAEGRAGGCIKRTSTSNVNAPGYLSYAPTHDQNGAWSAKASGICAFAIKIDDLNRLEPSPNTQSQPIYDALFVAYNGEWGMFGININRDGTLTLFKGLAATIYATSTGALVNNTWTFLEIAWTISKTAGSCTIRANEQVILSYSGPLYPSTSVFPSIPTEHWTSITVLGMQSTSTPFLVARMCDFVLMDTTGTSGNTFTGDFNIKYIRPDAPGTTTAWTPTGALNWQNVDEVPPNDDVDYNTATTPGTLDLYGFEPCAVDIPMAIQHVLCARRTTVGSATIQSVTRPVAANFLAPVQAVVNETYMFNTFPYDTNPATTAQWTPAQIDAAEFGPNKET